MWLEYGDLFHIIWDFEPLEDDESSSLVEASEYVARFINGTSEMNDTNDTS